MKNKLFVGLTTLVLAAVLFTSCDKVPEAEIAATNAAIDQAKVAGADVYVNDLYIALQDSMKSVMEQVEVQKSKFFKNFSACKEGLVKVNQLAVEVKQKAETRKEEIKVEVQATITEVKALVEANAKLITQAPKGKEGKAALIVINDEMTVIGTSITEAETMFANGELMGALDKIKAAKEKATAISAELTEAIEKYKGKGKK